MKAMWKGAISFGLVVIPCGLYRAAEAEEAHFKQAHRADGGGISQRRICKVCGEEVPYDQITKAMEMPDKSLAMLSDEEIAALDMARGDSDSRRAEVLKFTTLDNIDPAAFSNSYYVAPLPGGENAYALLREAMRRTDKVGLCQIKLNAAGKEKLAVLRLRDRVLILTTLLYGSEVREPDFKFLDEPDPRPKAGEVDLAKGLIMAMAADYDPAEHKDAYRAAVAQLAEAKVSGTPVKARKAAPAKASGTDLAAALAASVDAAKKRGKKAS